LASPGDQQTHLALVRRRWVIGQIGQGANLWPHGIADQHGAGLSARAGLTQTRKGAGDRGDERSQQAVGAPENRVLLVDNRPASLTDRRDQRGSEG